MSKLAEINYVEKMATVLKVPRQEVTDFIRGKPFTDARRAWYLIDLGQMLHLLPPPPRRVLDLGVGPGWTSRFLAMCGYDVVGLDICPDMIEFAIENGTGVPNLAFQVRDYENPIGDLGSFDAVVLYDALHHSLDEGAVMRTSYSALRPGGMLLTAEPGAGHSTSPGSIEAVERFGTTEKDMEFTRQRALMASAGFTEIRQYCRLSELPLERVETPAGADLQGRHFSALMTNTLSHGFTSLVVAVK